MPASPQGRTRSAKVLGEQPTARVNAVLKALAARKPMRKSDRLFEQHGQLLAEWTMFNRDGSAFLTAHSYAQFNDGLLTHLAGFWKL